MNQIVVGLGYGDEGKGLVTSYLCSKPENQLVVRFNGGHQCGHTVVYNGIRHVFSSFGSGTLQGIPTYWSKYCTIYPIALINEYNILLSKGVCVDDIKLFVNPLCPITTPYDLNYNQQIEKIKRHGSVGVGFGATIKRHDVDNYKLFTQDLFFDKVLKEKLINIKNYYINHYGLINADDIDMSYFYECVEKFKKIITLSNDNILYYHKCVYEGGQGILLDQDFGFFPHVTRSNTTSKNAIELCNTKVRNLQPIELFYVTRSYQTRHGNGFMSNENPNLKLINNELETNIKHEFQGEFRFGELDIDMINYSLMSDNNYTFNNNCSKNLVITCLDQHSIDIDNVLSKINPIIKFNKVFLSYGDSFDKITEYKRS